MADVEAQSSSTSKAPTGGVGRAAESSADLPLLQILWVRRWLVATVVGIFFVLGIVQVRQTTPIYTSVAVLKYEPHAGQMVDFGERSSILYQREEIRTAIQLVRTPSVAEAVLAALGPKAAPSKVEDKSPVAMLRGALTGMVRWVRGLMVSAASGEINDPRLARQSEVRSLLESVEVSQRPETKLLELRVSMPTAQLAERICSEFCTQFIRSVANSRRSEYSYQREFLESQIAETRKKLESAERALFDYAGQSDIQVLEAARDIAIKTMGELTQEVEQQRSALAVLESEADADVAAAAARQLIASGNAAVSSQLSKRREELMVQASQLAAENDEKFLPLQRLRREIEAITTQIERVEGEFVANYVKTRADALKSGEKKLAALEARLAEHKTKVNTIEKDMISFRVLQRDVDSARQIFNTLLDQFNRLEVKDDINVNTVTVESPASIPTAPSAPNVTRILGSFLFIGLVAGCSLVLLLHRMDRSVKDPAHIEAALSLPTLGAIPYLRSGKKEGLLAGFARRKQERVLLISEKDPDPVRLEAFRFLRTSINYSLPETGPKVLLVTSCQPAEGKSTIAANLATMFAEQGRRTLLVDADLKRPTIHKILSTRRIPGLSDLLTGQVPFEEAKAHSGFEHLDVVPAGFSSPSSLTLLESRAMETFLAEMRTRYDIVIVDSSPADGMADPMVLATRVDGIVLAVRHAKTSIESLTRVSRRMRSIGGRIVGVVYNSADAADQIAVQHYYPHYYQYEVSES